MPILPDTSWLSVSSEEPSTVSSIFISLDSLFSLSVMALTPKISSAGFVCPSATMLLNAPITASFGSFALVMANAPAAMATTAAIAAGITHFFFPFGASPAGSAGSPAGSVVSFAAPASVTSAPASGATIFSSAAGSAVAWLSASVSEECS